MVERYQISLIRSYVSLPPSFLVQPNPATSQQPTSLYLLNTLCNPTIAAQLQVTRRLCQTPLPYADNVAPFLR
jgi:hypothetical protein